MDRNQEIWETGSLLIESHFLDRCEQIKQVCLDKSQKLQNEFLSVLDRLFQKALAMQESFLLGEIKYISVGLLYSSAVTGSYESLLSAYDKDLYLGQECSTYWQPHFIYSYLSEDMEFLQSRISKYIPRISEYEMDQFRYRYVWSYHTIYRSWVESIAEKIFEIPSYLTLKRAGPVTLLFGEYMGETKKLYVS